MRLADKTAFVTGAGRGLGRACAARFAADGADLVLTDICHDIAGVPYPLATAVQLEHTAEVCRRAGAAVLVLELDVRNQAGVGAAVAAAVRRFGQIDVLVNDAGIAAPSGRPVHEITDDDWSLMLDVDLVGAFRLIREFVPHMLARGRGSIINIASTAGLVGYRHFAGYVTAKHAVVGLTKAAALDYAPVGIRVNALCPGSVRDTPEVDGRMLSEVARCLGVNVSEHEHAFIQSQPMNALVDPSDVAGAAAWLASDDARNVTGTVIIVDGGFTAR